MLTRKKVETALKRCRLVRASFGWNRDGFFVTEGYELVDPDVGDWTVIYTRGGPAGEPYFTDDEDYSDRRYYVLETIVAELVGMGLDASRDHVRVVISRGGI